MIHYPVIVGKTDLKNPQWAKSLIGELVTPEGKEQQKIQGTRRLAQGSRTCLSSSDCGRS